MLFSTVTSTLRRRKLTFASAIVVTIALGTFIHSRGVAGASQPSVGNPLDHNTMSRTEAIAKFAALPLYFERNDGQSDPSVHYLSRTPRSTVFLGDQGTLVSMVGGTIHKGPQFYSITGQQKPEDRLVESNIRVRFAGGNAHPKYAPLEPLQARVNYLIGADPTKYHRSIPTFGKVKLEEVYPGVDVVYYGTPDKLEYDIVAKPGADVSKIKLIIDGDGTTNVDSDGNIHVAAVAGSLMIRNPVIYQTRADGTRDPIDGKFAMRKKASTTEIGLQLAAYDRTRTLVIDPGVELVYSSYIGGTGDITGTVNLEQFAGVTGGAALTVADVGSDVAIDNANHAWVTGVAYSTDFPTSTGVLQTSQNAAASSNPNSFVSKFDYSKSGAASLVYSTYFGGSGDTSSVGSGDGDLAFGIAVDAGGNAFVVGQTYSPSDFPGPPSSLCGAWGSSMNQSSAATNNGFVIKLKPDGSGLVYSCFVPGKNNATESRVALFPSGCGVGAACKAYVAGSTQSDSTTGFPTTASAFQSTNLATSGKSQATFLVVHEDGKSLDYATLYGGNGNGTNSESGIGIAVDANGNGYIAGATYSLTGLTTKNAAQPNYNGKVNKTSNAFVTEFNPSASGAASLLYATYEGGNGSQGLVSCLGSKVNLFAVGDVATSVAVDSSNKIWLAGFTASTGNFPVPGSVMPVFQSTNQAAVTSGAPATTGFLTEIDPSLAPGVGQFLYSTYFGGTGYKITAPAPCTGGVGFGDVVTDLQVVGGNVYFVGATASAASTGSTFPLSANACFKTNNTSGFPFDVNLPVLGTLQYNIPITGFAAELSTSKNQLLYSSLLGGSGELDVASGGKLDPNGNMVIAGLTFSTDFPTTTTGFQKSNNADANASSNAFLTVLNPTSTDSSPCPTPGVTGLPTATATATATSGATPTRTATPTATATPTVAATRTATPTATATSTSKATATATPTATPTGVPSPAVLKVSPTKIDFGKVTASLTGKPKLVTIINSGKVDANITGVNSAAPISQFVIASNTCTSTLSLKRSCKIGVAFAPNAVSSPSVSGNLTISYNGAGPLQVSLGGTGIAPTVSAPKTLSFPATAINTLSKPKTVTITNTSGATITVGAPGSLTNFVLVHGADQCTNAVLGPPPAASKKCTMQVAFQPDGPSGPVTPETLTYPFSYGSGPVLNGSVSVTLKGTAK
ncbi:MAG TPA: hypothetical protein VMT61_09720 [Candidatus Binataceae bacterium]|nr:hypothetical protein [Candidatus Binataceae bacterium]